MVLRQGVKAALPNTQNKHREAAKMKRQRNMAQMKEQTKTPEKRTEQNRDKQYIRCKVQNIGY